MKRQIIREEEFYTKVASPVEVISMQGFSGELIGGKVFLDSPYIDNETDTKLFNEIIQQFDIDYKGSWMPRPKLTHYWKTVNELEKIL